MDLSARYRDYADGVIDSTQWLAELNAEAARATRGLNDLRHAAIHGYINAALSDWEDDRFVAAVATPVNG